MGGLPASSDCLSCEGELRSSPQVRQSLVQREALPPIYLFSCNWCNAWPFFVREMQRSVRRISMEPELEIRDPESSSGRIINQGLLQLLHLFRFLPDVTR